MPTLPSPPTAERAPPDHPAGRHYGPLVVVAAAGVAGIVLDRSAAPRFEGAGPLGPAGTVGFAIWWFAAGGSLAAWWGAWYRGRAAGAAVLLLLAVAMAGAAWHQLHWQVYAQADVGRYARLEAQPACLTGTVRRAATMLPAPRPTPLRAIPGLERTRVELSVDAIRDRVEWIPAAGRCELTVDGHLLGVQPGDRVRVLAQLRRPGSPRNPGEFDFAAAARADRRLATLRAVSPDCVTVIADRGGWSFSGVAARIRGQGRRLLDRYVGPARGDLAAAVLLGDRAGLPTEQIEPYFLTGTIHLLVVSGLHVGILAMGLLACAQLGWLSRRRALAITALVVLGYVLVTGAQPPVLRAGVLVGLVCLAAWTGRRGVAFNSLAAAALTVLAINPCEAFQTGTQLSFLAVTALIVFAQWASRPERATADPLDQLIAETRPRLVRAADGLARYGVWMLLAGAAVWLAALPLVLYRFHLVTPVAVLLGPVVWLLVFFALWSGFLTLLSGWVLPPLAAVFGVACDGLLASLESIVRWAEALPAGHFWTPGPALWWVLGFYTGAAALLVWGGAVKARWRIAVFCLWVLCGLVPPLARAATGHDAIRCSFLSLGHGAAVVLELPGGKTLLYDAGSLGSPEHATRVVAGYLWHRGIERLDGIVLSHADVDHYNAVPGLVERFPTAAVYVSPLMFDRFGASGPSGGPAELERALNAAEVPIREVWAGDRLRAGRGVSLTVLHPLRQGVPAGDNANSIVLAIEHAGRRVLLPGDLEPPGLDDLVAESPYDCDVLLAPHHGSRRSDPPGLAQWCMPEVVVISSRSRTDPLVRQTYERAGARVLNTAERGAVCVTLAADRAAAVALPKNVRRAAK